MVFVVKRVAAPPAYYNEASLIESKGDRVKSGRYAATLMEVSRRVPIRYATLLEKRKMPGFPKDHSPGKAKYDVDEIRRWIHEHKSAHNFGGNGNGIVNERERGLIEKNKIIAERERFKLDVERNKYELKSKVREDVLTYVKATFRELDKAFGQELPPQQDGCKAIEIARMNMKKLNQLRDRLVKSFESNGNGSS